MRNSSHHHPLREWSRYDQIMATQEVDEDISNIFPLTQLPPLDHLSYSASDCHYVDLTIQEAAFDALPLMSSFPEDCPNLYASLDLISNQPLFQEDFFGYENELESAWKLHENNTSPFGFQPKNQPPVSCNIENNWVENCEKSIIISEKKEKSCATTSDKEKVQAVNTCSKKLSKKTIAKYFYMPITQAAKEMNVGLTLLKKRCRELGIRRWPHRKLMSLQTLIKNIQKLHEEEGGGEDGRLGEAIKILKEEIKLMEEAPDIELEDRTKRLRQACFKANYKKRKLMGMMDQIANNLGVDVITNENQGPTTDYDHDEEEMKSLLSECYSSNPKLVFKI